MKAYIHCNSKNDYQSINGHVAAIGFESLGYEVIKFQDVKTLPLDEPEDIIVGGVGIVRSHLSSLGFEVPPEMEYPNELRDLINRKIWKTDLQFLIRENVTDVFIKPLKTKFFSGRVISSFNDYLDLNFEEEIEVWCSEPITFITEWRCFIRYGEILDIRYYKGNWDSQLDLNIIEKSIKKYQTQPASFALDIAIAENGQYYLVEVNDGHSLGTYGMGSISYAKFLSARWAQLTQTKDYLNF